MVADFIFLEASSRIHADLLGVSDYGMAAQRISIQEGSIASFASEDVFRHVSVSDLRQ
jgi:hypothetical protein